MHEDDQLDRKIRIDVTQNSEYGGAEHEAPVETGRNGVFNPLHALHLHHHQKVGHEIHAEEVENLKNEGKGGVIDPGA